MTRFRFVARVAAGLAALVVIVVLCVAVLFNSESFSRWLLATLAERSNGTLQIESVSGSFGSGLRIGSLAVDLDAGNAAVSAIDITLDWRSLVARSLVIDSLNIQRLDVVVARTDSTAGEMDPAELSMLVLIRELNVNEINVLMNESEYAIGDLALELRLLRNRLELNSVSARYDQLTVNGSAALTLTQDLEVDVMACVNGMLIGERIVGCIESIGDLAALQIAAELNQPFALTVNGTLDPTGNGAVEMDAAWQNAALSGVTNFASPDGTAHVSGTMARPRLEARGTAEYEAQSAEFTMDAIFDASAIDVASLRLTQGAAAAEFSGELTSALDRGDFVLELQNIDPQVWLPGWPGMINATTELAIRMQPALEVAARDIVARGTLRDNPIAAVGAIRYLDQALAIDTLQIVSRTDQITVAGTLGNELDLEVQAAINELGTFSPNLSGSLAADLQITNTPAQPAVRGMLDLANFSTAGLAAENMHITGDAGLAATDLVNLLVVADGVQIANSAITAATFDVTGTAMSHQVVAQLTADRWSSRLVGNGALEDLNWAGRISELDFIPDGFGLWRLRVPAEVRYGEAGYSVSELCLSYELSSLCGAVAVSGTPEDYLEVSAINFDVSILEPFMPASLRAKGLLNANASLSNFVDDPRGEIEFDAADAQLDVALGGDVMLPVPIAAFEFDAVLDDAGANLSARLDAAEMGGASAVFTIDNPRREDSPLRGSISLDWNDVAVVSLLSPDVEGVQGRFDASLDVAGTVAEPLLDGSASWSAGALEVPAWGLTIDQIVASIEAGETRDAVISANGLVDSRPIEIDGTILLDPEQGWPMQLQLNGEDLSLVQLVAVEMNVSPSLEVSVQLPDINVTGNVAVPYARIRDIALPQQAVVPSPDTVVHGRELDEAGRPIVVTANIFLELGNDVTYEDANLNAAVTGRLNLDYQSGQGAAAQGALRLTGQYDAYGNPLALERGQLIFVGPLNNPSLDILAVRVIDDVEAGVQLTGTLRSPVTTMYSDPAMSDADALGWLLFGRPLDRARETDSSELRSAALSMGLQQAFPVIERIGETLRLDDFAIRNTATDAGALMAGKYFSPNLYFRYSYGLFNRIGGLLLRYRISDRLSLETRSGEHNSMDLLYTIEKN